MGLKREERFCPICPIKSIEDEGHFLADCLLYSPLWKNLFSKIKQDYSKSQENLNPVTNGGNFWPGPSDY